MALDQASPPQAECKPAGLVQASLTQMSRQVGKPAPRRARLPVLLEVNVSPSTAFVGMEPATFEDFHDTGRLRILVTAILFRMGDADHRRVAAQEDVRARRVEHVSQLSFE